MTRRTPSRHRKSPKQVKASRRVKIPARITPLLTTIGRLAAKMEMPAFAVGGCVRDWMLGAETVDLDVTVDGSGIDLARAVAVAFKASVEVHQHFGTATLHLLSSDRETAGPGSDFPVPRVDFATCRQERYPKPAAYPEVALGTLRQDLFRRDFTINAMAVALSPDEFGVLVDPYGGAADLRQRWLRILHDRSFIDDPSRILRGIRLARHFKLRWELHTRRALQEAMDAGMLSLLNAGRIRKELTRMAQGPDARECFQKLAGLLEGGGR